MKNIMKFYRKQRKMYNLLYVLQIILYIHPFPGLHDGDVERLEHRLHAQFRFQFGPTILLIFSNV